MMQLLAWAQRGLALLGRHAPLAFALALVFGFAAPWLAAPLRPYLGLLIFAFIAINMLRADLPELRRLMHSPIRLAVALAWSTLAPALVAGALVALAGRGAFEPGLLLGMAIAAASPPVVATPAYAVMLGFSNATPLAMLVLGMVVTPATAPLIADAIVGSAAPIDRLALALRLAEFLFGAVLVGLAVRRVAGVAWIARCRAEFDGAGVVLFFLFGVTLTQDVARGVAADPLRVLLYCCLSVAICCASCILTFMVWRRFGRADAITLATGVGLRNSGLLIAVMGVNDVPESTFLYFAILQLPVYFAPQLAKPFLDRLLAGESRRRDARPL